MPLFSFVRRIFRFRYADRLPTFPMAMEEEHYDTPWEYKNRIISAALRPRPHSSNVALTASCSREADAMLHHNHKSMLIRPSADGSPSSPPRKLKELPQGSPRSNGSSGSRSSSDRSRNGSGDYPFIKNTSVSGSARKSTGLMGSMMLKKLNRFNENELIHDGIDRCDAEALLLPRPVGEFLLRKRTDGGNLALSLRASEGVLHIKLEQRDNNAWVLGEGPQFASITGCLKYYYRTALPIRGSEHILLKAPLLANPVH
uniref:SH2 domain-containing protein n=1 Tax=Panagrellus redivivus TaxID=6233 RepID=A0A7E4VY96_PANRE